MPIKETITIDEAILRALRQAYPTTAEYKTALRILLGKTAYPRSRGRAKHAATRETGSKKRFNTVACPIDNLL